MSRYTRNCELKPGMVFPPGMQRIALGLEYNGSHFHGFQMQKSAAATVQQVLQSALSSVADEPVSVVAAGRTDAGVHATQQVVHFDTLVERPLKAWTLGVNGRLPDGVSVKWARAVSPDFHARFSARARCYRYLIHNEATRPAILRDQVTWQKRPMDFPAMVAAAACLKGEHDFSSFRAAQCQAASPVREVQALRFARHRRIIAMEIKANAFLHHMVRNVAGVLMAVACGDKSPGWVEAVLAARDRSRAGVTAPAAGLYLVDVEYPARFQLPREPAGPDLLPEALQWQSA